MDISGLEVGKVVLAKGYGPAGGRTWFLARITKFRPRFPPIVVTFTATHPMGLTQQLLLPQPRVSHVPKTDVRLLDDEAPDAPAANPNRQPPPVRSDPVMVHELEGRRVSCERNGRRLDGEVLAASAKGTRFTIEWHDGSQATRPRAHAPTPQPFLCPAVCPSACLTAARLHACACAVPLCAWAASCLQTRHLTACFRACPPAQSKHSKHALQPMLCPPPRVEDLSYLRASKKSDKHPYHPARVGESYQATLPAWEAPAASCEGLPSPAAVEAAAAGCGQPPPPPRASTESTVQPDRVERAAAASTGAARALAGTTTTAAVLHRPARAPVPVAPSVSSMLPGCSVLARGVPSSAPASAGAPASASARAPVLAAAARSSAALPFAVVVPRGKAAKQAAAAAGEERRWAATIASAEAVELELEAVPPPPHPLPSKPASPQPCRSPATQSAPLGADFSSSPQRKRARVGSPCFDLSNLS